MKKLLNTDANKSIILVLLTNFLYSSRKQALPRNSVRWQYKENPQFCLFAYPRGDGKIRHS